MSKNPPFFETKKNPVSAMKTICARAIKNAPRFLGFLAVFAVTFILSVPAVSASGLVPCGGPDEPDCNICFFIEMTKRAVDFVLRTLVVPAAALLLAFGGFMLLFSSDDPQRVNTAKTIIKTSIMGLVIIFSGWLIVNTFMMAIGVEEWTGLKEGWWKIKMTCSLPEPPIPPPPPVCQADSGVADWDKLGMGCYLDENGNGTIDGEECRKGKYICDPEANDGAGQIVCVNVYGDIQYSDPKYQTSVYQPADDYMGKDDWYVADYCCENMMEEYADGKVGEKPFTIVRATPDDVHLTGGATIFQAWLGSSVSLDNPKLWTGGIRGGFNCDEVCKKYGKICVGVGLTDPSKNACVYEVHDESTISPDASKCNNPQKMTISMRLSGNTAYNNCKAFFGFIYYSYNNQRWSTGYDKYEYFCSKYDPRSYHTFGAGPAEKLGLAGKVNDVPEDTCGSCKPNPAPGASCSGNNYAQDPADSCAFHGNDLGETACYCF